jgi:hypothetical protein
MIWFSLIPDNVWKSDPQVICVALAFAHPSYYTISASITLSAAPVLP